MYYKSFLLSISILVCDNSFTQTHFLDTFRIQIPPTAQDIQNHQNNLYSQADNAIKLKPFAEQDSIRFSSLPFLATLAGAVTGAILTEEFMQPAAALLGGFAGLLITLPIEEIRISSARPAYERALAQAELARKHEVDLYYQRLLATTPVNSSFNNQLHGSIARLQNFDGQLIAAFTAYYNDSNSLIYALSLPYSRVEFHLLTATRQLNAFIDELVNLQRILLTILDQHSTLSYELKRAIEHTMLVEIKNLLGIAQTNAIWAKQTTAYQVEEARKQALDLAVKKQEQLEAERQAAQAQIALMQQKKRESREREHAAQAQARKEREAYLIARQNQREAHGQGSLWADVADRVLY
jgi:hypothetical protein